MPRLWTSPNLTFNEINCFFDAFLNKEDPHYRNLINLVLDPREPPEGKERHIPIPVALDSTKVRVQKSNDYAFQKSTFYTKLGKNFITFMNASAPDGFSIDLEMSLENQRNEVELFDLNNMHVL